MTIASRLHHLLKKIRTLEAELSRPQGSIQLLAVSKGQPLSAIEEAIEAGQRAFGENYCQEALSKITKLQSNPKHSDLIWHFIGPVQTNKIKNIAKHFDWVHSIDRLEIAEGLQDQRPLDAAPLRVCIQVNLAKERSKHGLFTEEVIPFAQKLLPMTRLKLEGLMLIPAKTLTPEAQYPIFFQLHQQLLLMNQELGTTLKTLSMGMSHDFTTAIRAGSTLVRIGQALFGARI